MDRIEDVNQEELDALIAAQMAEANSAMWGDWDLTELIDSEGFPTENPSGIYADRRTRPHVAYYYDTTGAWLPSRLKPNDHVRMLNAFNGVVAMASRDREFFLLYAPDTYGPYLVPLDISGVTDRAPADPLEAPMPINAPWPLEAPPLPDVTITTTIAAEAHSATLTTTLDDDGIHTTVEGD